MRPVQLQLLSQALWWLTEAIRTIPIQDRTAQEQDTLLLAALIRHRLSDASDTDWPV